MTKLGEIDATWRAHLRVDFCPPLLGLAPLSDEECAEIGREVEAALNSQIPRSAHRVHGIGRLLNSFPAVTAIWLSRLAGEAYDAGKFYENFAPMLGCADVPVNVRADFAASFRRACRSTMSAFVEPELGSFRYVGEFLFQAGLPLCHCARFAGAMRGVADAYGLPEPDDAEALADFREAMLARTEVRQAPVIRLALETASGAHLLAVAVRVVREEAFAAINPKLGQRLRESFASVSIGVRGAAVRWPWLRLDDDLTSFSIVGPRQPAALLGASGVRWVVDGAPHRVGVDDDFVFPVSGQARLRVEMLGLAGGRPLQREFALHPSKESFAAFVFSEGRRRVRVPVEKQCKLDAGDYWLVHPAEFVLDDANEAHAWLAGPTGLEPLATSRLTLRPGRDPVLRNGFGEPVCEFQAAARPFIDLQGERLCDAEGEWIHYGWTHLPQVWVPIEEVDQRWTLHFSVDGKDRQFSLSPLPSEDGGSLKVFSVAGDDGALAELPAGIHTVRIELRRNDRRVAERTVWLWHGLEGMDERGFRCVSTPANLVESEMRGFSLDGTAIRHADNQLRLHTLTFRIADERRTFVWRRPGVFIESFEKHPGRAVHPREHRLGESFSASLDSHRWLRIWVVPPDDAGVLLNGAEIFRFFPGSKRQFMDFSLAQLSAQSEQGGRLLLQSKTTEPLLLARFTRPLVPVISQYSTGHGYETLLCKFNDAVGSVRVHLREIVSGRDVRFQSRSFPPSGHLIFREEGLPGIEVCNIAKDGSCAGELHRLEMAVPEEGWAAGLWLIEVEISREEMGGCQPMLNSHGGRTPIVLIRPPLRDDAAPYRARCLAAVLTPPLPGADPYFPPSNDHESELAELLGELRGWLAEKFEDVAWQKLRPLQLCFGQLAKQARWQIGNNPSAILPGLVAQMAEEGEALGPRSLFVLIPDLLALPAELGGALPASDPVRGALRWAAGLAAADCVSGGFRRVCPDEPFGLGEPSADAPILREFANSKSVLGIGSNCDPDDDLAGFKFAAWFSRMERDTRGDFEAALDEADALSAEHWKWAMRSFVDRRRRMGDNEEWGPVLTVFTHNKIEWLFDLRMMCPSVKHTFPTLVQGRVWWDCERDDDFLVGEIVQFSAVLALALALALGARASAQRWLSFWNVLKPLREKHGPKPVHKALTTLLTQAPELLGFHLMFWELMIRTYPHD